MTPSIFATCRASAGVRTALGSNPVRLYEFGSAPDAPAKPYAVFRTISGQPENMMGDVPDTDSWIIQIDVYGDTAASVRTAAQALRDAIEPVAYISAWRGESEEPDTKLSRFQFDVDWTQSR